MGHRGHGRYARGDNAVAICERCAKKTLRRHLVYDGQYPDLLVCTDCWDPKHPQEYLPDVSDPVTIYDPTGDPERSQANILDVVWNPGSDPQGVQTGTFALDPLSPIPVSPFRPQSFLSAERITIHPMGVESIVGASPYQLVPGQPVSDWPSGEDIPAPPDPVGTLIAHTETTGSEKPDQYDSSNSLTWINKNFDRNPNGTGQVGVRHGLVRAFIDSEVYRWISVGREAGGTGSADNYASDNEGFDWNPITSTAGAGQKSWAVDQGNDVNEFIVVVGALGHIETSTTGFAWTARTSGVATDLYSVKWIGSKYWACGASGVVLTSSDGITWTATTASPGAGLSLRGITSNGSRVFVGASDGSVYYTDNDGVSWTAGAGVTLGAAIQAIAHDGVNTIIAVGLSSGVYRSTDNGANYTLIPAATTGFNAGAMFYTGIYDDGDPTDPYAFVIGGWNGLTGNQAYIARSINGASWSVQVASGDDDSAVTTVQGRDTRQ